ncbi:hypothetical protein Tco_1385765 [Tanacetum coccineum]
MNNENFSCMIGQFNKERAYLDLESPINIMYRLHYNWIMSNRLEPRGNPSNPKKNCNFEEEEEEEEHPALADFVPPVHHTITTPNSPTHIKIPESCLPFRKRARFASPTPSPEVGEPDDLVGAIDEIAPTTVEGVNQRVTDLATIVEEETTSMYGIMEDARDNRSQLRGRVNLLYRDRPVHRRLAVMIEREAKMALAQSALISELQSADRRRQKVITELLTSDHKRQVQLTKTLRLLKGLQTQMAEFQRQHGPAKGNDLTKALLLARLARDATRNGDDSHIQEKRLVDSLVKFCSLPCKGNASYLVVESPVKEPLLLKLPIAMPWRTCKR